MIVAAARPFRAASGAVPRGILAGTAWGMVMGFGLPLLTFVNCGVICLSDVAFTTALSVAAGVATFGPLAAFARRNS